MAIVARPTVEVYQQLQPLPQPVVDATRAAIIGGNALLHRYSDVDEKAGIKLGSYDRLNDSNFVFPSRTAGSKIDSSYVKLFADSAHMMYFEDLMNSTAGGRGTVAPVSGRRNRVRSSAISFKTNGAYARSALLYDRDAQIGDAVYIRGIEDPSGACIEHELWTSIVGFAGEAVAASVATAAASASNQATTSATTSASQIGGPRNCIGLTADAAAYDGLPSGRISETYTIEVVRSSVSGCDAARLRVSSASGLDNDTEVEASLSTWIDIGVRGLIVQFTTTSGACSASATSNSVAANEFIVGQKWQVVVQQAFKAAVPTVAGTYTGVANDSYIVTVTKGGLWADLPQITVTTAAGTDYSGPTTITAASTAFAIGTRGLTISFAASSGSLTGLRFGDVFTVAATAASEGAMRTLVLRHDLPDGIVSATDLDLRLFLVGDIPVAANRADSPPNKNWRISDTESEVSVYAGMTAYHNDWTSNGVKLPLPVHKATLYLEYREWLPAYANTRTVIAGSSDVADIPGQLHPDNPLKQAASLALAASNGVSLLVTAVADPDDTDSWSDAIARYDGHRDYYNFVPLTDDRTILNLFHTAVTSESGPRRSNPKGMFVPLRINSTRMVVGKSAASSLIETSSDGKVVMAVLEDDPQTSGTQYTKLRVTSGNASFIEYGVRAGDTVRFLFSTDGFGVESYASFTVASVLSEGSLLVASGNPVAVAQAQRVEVWRALKSNEIVDDLITDAQSWADRRVCAVIPDQLGLGSYTVAGYNLCAVLAGMASGVNPHQCLSNVVVPGFSSYTRVSKLFSAAQIDRLAQNGVWVVTTDRNGSPHTVHAVTTDVTDLKSSEESFRRNIDSIANQYYAAVLPYIGQANLHDGLLSLIDTLLRGLERELTRSTNAVLGPQATVLQRKRLEIHPFLRDHMIVEVDVTGAVPNNVTRIYLNI